jgi:hypothetical protein
MFGSCEVQLFRHIAVAPKSRADRSLPLRPEHFPLEARGREIVSQHGVVIATAADAAMGEEIARRLNGSDLSDQEDQWAL